MAENFWSFYRLYS